MSHPAGFGLKSDGQDATTDDLRAVWRIADQAGFDHAWVFDHLGSTGTGGPDRSVFEGWSLQVAMAVATRRSRIGCTVTGTAYRDPGLAAKVAVSVDHQLRGLAV